MTPTARRRTAAGRRPAGLPDGLAGRLAGIGASAATLDRIARVSVPWALVDELLDTEGLRGVHDVTGLCVLWRSDFTSDEIRAWARLGSLDAAYRLVSLDVGVSVASAVIRRSERGLDGVVRMVQEANKNGIRQADLLLWHAGGVLTPQPPYLDQRRFATWRAVAVHHLGMHRAALACAAGLGPREAVTGFADGSVTEKALLMLAGLRGLPGW